MRLTAACMTAQDTPSVHCGINLHQRAICLATTRLRQVPDDLHDSHIIVSAFFDSLLQAQLVPADRKAIRH